MLTQDPLANVHAPGSGVDNRRLPRLISQADNLAERLTLLTNNLMVKNDIVFGSQPEEAGMTSAGTSPAGDVDLLATMLTKIDYQIDRLANEIARFDEL